MADQFSKKRTVSPDFGVVSDEYHSSNMVIINQFSVTNEGEKVEGSEGWMWKRDGSLMFVITLFENRELGRQSLTQSFQDGGADVIVTMYRIKDAEGNGNYRNAMAVFVSGLFIVLLEHKDKSGYYIAAQSDYSVDREFFDNIISDCRILFE